MSLTEYQPGTAFPGRMGRTIGESDPAWPAPLRAEQGAPNVLFIVLDDTGFGQLGCYGSRSTRRTSTGWRRTACCYTNMHTTALCSPTRSCMLTGRNHHSNAMACITEGSTGYPGSNGDIPFENGFLSEMLLQHGYNTYCVGKWHLTPAEQISAAGPVRPLAAGPRLRALLRLPRRRHPPVLSRTWSTTTTRSSRRRRRRRATTSPRIWPTRPSRSSPTSSRSRPTSRSSCTSPPAPTTRRTTCPRSGPTSTRASSTTAGTPTARRCSPGRRSSASSPQDAELSRHDPDVQEWDKLAGRRTQALRADDGGVRRLPRAHRPPHRPAARLPAEPSASSTTR